MISLLVIKVIRLNVEKLCTARVSKIIEFGPTHIWGRWGYLYTTTTWQYVLFIVIMLLAQGERGVFIECKKLEWASGLLQHGWNNNYQVGCIGNRHSTRISTSLWREWGVLCMCFGNLSLQYSARAENARLENVWTRCLGFLPAPVLQILQPSTRVSQRMQHISQFVNTCSWLIYYFKSTMDFQMTFIQFSRIGQPSKQTHVPQGTCSPIPCALLSVLSARWLFWRPVKASNIYRILSLGHA